MATKKFTGPRKPSGPARTAAANATGPSCEAACTRSAVIFHRWKWWCKTHDPGCNPDPACSHTNPSVVNGELTCSFCGGVLLKAVPDE